MTTVFYFDQASTVRAHLEALTATGAPALLSLLVVAFGRRQAWWWVPLIALIAPLTMIVWEAWPAPTLLYAVGVALPQALLFGLPGALVGGLIGVVLRNLRRPSVRP
jgi:hypothetical protein